MTAVIWPFNRLFKPKPAPAPKPAGPRRYIYGINGECSQGGKIYTFAHIRGPITAMLAKGSDGVYYAFEPSAGWGSRVAYRGDPPPGYIENYLAPLGLSTCAEIARIMGVQLNEDGEVIMGEAV